MKGLSVEEAGIVSGTDFAGTYRRKPAYAAAIKMAKPSKIPGANKSMVSKLQAYLAEVGASG